MKKINLLLTLFLALFCIQNVSAMENSNEYYTTHRGVVMPVEDYNYLVSQIPKYTVETLSEEDYKTLMDDISNYKVLSEDIKYISTTYYKDPLGNERYFEEELTEDEYDNFNAIELQVLCSEGDVCWETNAKKLILRTEVHGLEYTFSSELKWKTIPKVRSYDVNAIRWETSAGNFIPTSYMAMAFENYGEVPPARENYNVQSNGIGVSIKQGENITFPSSNMLVIAGHFTADNVTKIVATYQHATQNLTLAQSKNYYFNANGLGGALYYYDANVMNSYDKMQGIYKIM